MTIGELIVHNSTIPSGQGTVLQHLSNIQTIREAYCAITVEVADLIELDIQSTVVEVDFHDDNITCDIVDNTEINLITETIGVNV